MEGQVLAGYWDGAISRRVPERGLAAFWSGETGSWAGIWGMVVVRGTEQGGKPHYSTAHETAGFTKHSLLLFISITADFGTPSLHKKMLRIFEIHWFCREGSLVP